MTPFFWDKHLESNSHFEMNTIVKTSSIPHAGKGRFTLEDVKKGQLISKAKLILVEDYINIAEENKDDANYFIVFNNYSDLDLLFEYFKSHNLLPDEEIQLKMSWFISLGGSTVKDKLYIRSHSSFYNHSVNQNVECKMGEIDDEIYMFQYAFKDITKNEELFINYCDMEQYENTADYYLKWCSDNNVCCSSNGLKL
jgi:hypothetical protein